MKRLLFDLTPLYDHLSGIERYALNITKSFIESHSEFEYVLAFKNEIHPEFINISKNNNVKVDILTGKNKLAFQQIVMMKYIRRLRNIDYYMFLASSFPLLCWRSGLVCTVHDMAPWDCPQSMRKKQEIYGKLMISSTIKKSTIIGTVSTYSKNRIVDLLKVENSKVIIAYDGLSDIFKETPDKVDASSVMVKYGISKNYLLCLSTLEPRKNMKLLIQAYVELKKEGRIDCELVLAGRKGWKIEEVLGNAEEDHKGIIITGFVDDHDLPALYREADAFVFPSLYEGFGIPVIEAMSQGTIVISSNSSSLPEVGGDAAIYFENGSLEELKKAIVNCYTLSEEEKKELAKKSINQSHAFDWKNEAEKYYNAIK